MKNKSLKQLKIRKGNFFDLEGRIIDARPIKLATIKIISDFNDLSDDMDIIYKTGLIRRIQQISPKNSNYYVLSRFLPQTCLLEESQQVWYCSILYLKNRKWKRK